MKYFVAPEHAGHFRKSHMIELEGLLTEQQAAQLSQHIEQTLLERSQLPQRLFSSLSPLDRFRIGRDIWRYNEGVRKLVFRHDLLEIVASLTDQKVLRLGYDQYFPAMGSKSQWQERSSLSGLERAGKIEEISCLQGVVGGMMICLKGEALTTNSESLSSCFLPSRSGNIVVLGSQAILGWPQLLQEEKREFLFVAYTEQNGVYVHKEADPNSAFLKNYGYHFGDRLKDTLHPILYRR